MTHPVRRSTERDIGQRVAPDYLHCACARARPIPPRLRELRPLLCSLAYTIRAVARGFAPLGILFSKSNFNGCLHLEGILYALTSEGAES